MKVARFLERTLGGLAAALEQIQVAEAGAEAAGWLQELDARVKLAGLLGWVAVGVAAQKWEVPLGLGLLAAGLAVSSGLPTKLLFKLGWLPAGTLALGVGLPALLVVPGPAVAEIGGLTLSQPGLESAIRLLIRAECSVTVAMLLTFTTPWPELVRALRWFRMPALVTALLSMTQRYLFLLLETAAEMFTARRARVVGEIGSGMGRTVATATAGVLLEKSFQLSEQTAMAMQARGFRGDFPAMRSRALKAGDLWMGAGIVGVGLLALAWSLV